MSNKKEPPIILVKTWIDLIRSDEYDEVKRRASEMLIYSLFFIFQYFSFIILLIKTHKYQFIM